MNFNSLDYIIYSSQKTSTQSLMRIFNINGIRSKFFHKLTALKFYFSSLKRKTYEEKKQLFIKALEHYKIKNRKGRKMQIITVIRNPKERSLSSFFQSFYSDEMIFKGKAEANTTVNNNNIDELLVMYEDLIRNNNLPGRMESLDEISEIFNINIIENLEKRNNYYYYDHDLFELYVLDFKMLISDECIKYLNDCLGTNLIRHGSYNLSKDKPYYEKYTIMKTKIKDEIYDIIESQYNNFYFTAFP